MKDLSGFTPCALPGSLLLEGRLVRLEPYVGQDHAAALAGILAGDAGRALWTFMPIGPFDDPADFQAAFEAVIQKGGWSPYVIRDRTSGEMLGTASYMRQRPEHGSIEVGCVAFSPGLQKTAHASEAMYLMAAHVMDDLHYRRYEWKCHNENAASKRAAARFGFQFEGVFRNDMVMKGKSRDTAWFAMTDDDWPAVKAGFEAWLSPENFDAAGRQKISLSAIRAASAQQQQQQQ